MDLKQQRVLFGSLLLGSLIVSILLWLIFVPSFKPIVLYFPAADNASLESEIHYIPWSNNDSDRIRHLVKALTTGPLSMKYRRIVPANATVRAVYLKGKQVWIDFDARIQAPDIECPLSPKERISTITRSVRFNYPSLNSVKILIEGQELGVIHSNLERKS